MEFANFVFPIIIAMLAMGVSVFNLFFYIKDIYNKTTTSERVKWINAVRQLIANFIEAYVSDSSNEDKLIFIKSHIELFLNHENPDHYELSNTLSRYLNDRDLPINELTAISQIVFKNSWERMKYEAGITKREEKKYRKLTMVSILNR